MFTRHTYLQFLCNHRSKPGQPQIFHSACQGPAAPACPACASLTALGAPAASARSPAAALPTARGGQAPPKHSAGPAGVCAVDGGPDNACVQVSVSPTACSGDTEMPQGAQGPVGDTPASEEICQHAPGVAVESARSQQGTKGSADILGIDEAGCSLPTSQLQRRKRGVVCSQPKEEFINFHKITRCV